MGLEQVPERNASTHSSRRWFPPGQALLAANIWKDRPVEHCAMNQLVEG